MAQPKVYKWILIAIAGVTGLMFSPLPVRAEDVDHIIKLELHNLAYDKQTRKKYPFLENDLDSKSYLDYDPYGEKIELYDAVFKSYALNKIFYFIYNASGAAYCNTLGCSLDGYIKSGSQYKNVISTTTFTDIYFKDCLHEQSLLLGGNDGYTEWRFNGQNFEMTQAYKKFFQVAFCTE
jgi:hypothetical protein